MVDFVTRQPHPADRRAFLVTFTTRGAETMAAMRRDQQAFAKLLFADMPAKRFDGLLAGLDDILARLRRHGLAHRIGEHER